MPLLNDATMNEQALPSGHYGYSATRLEDLGASEYTLVTIVNDVSGSVNAFVDPMEKTLAEILRACKQSPRADNLLVRLAAFSDDLEEIHGFKLLEQCKPADYKGVLRIHGNTALYDGAENAVAATISYGRRLTEADFTVNAIVFVITDGMDNASRLGVSALRDALEAGVKGEALESLVSVLVGVNVQDRNVSAYLQKLKTDAGFSQYIELGRADAKALARLAEFVSRSIAVQSQALGTGASKSLVF